MCVAVIRWCVHQKIKEGSKECIQMFEGVVIRTDNKATHESHYRTQGRERYWCGEIVFASPLAEKVEVVRHKGSP